MRAFPSDFRLLLASQSPRRRDLLAALGVPYEVVTSTAEEMTEGIDPHTLARDNALAKAWAAHLPEILPLRLFVLGTDTVVTAGGRVLGKPAGRVEAGEMLRALQGREHAVVSGVALRCWRAQEGWREAAGTSSTVVRFCSLEESEMEAYLDSGEWEGKAGGYAIQGLAALFVEGIRGDYSNVVGLPLNLLRDLFTQLGFDLLRREWRRPPEQV